VLGLAWLRAKLWGSPRGALRRRPLVGLAEEIPGEYPKSLWSYSLARALLQNAASDLSLARRCSRRPSWSGPWAESLWGGLPGRLRSWLSSQVIVALGRYWTLIPLGPFGGMG